jgi:hypothetical protein
LIFLVDILQFPYWYQFASRKTPPIEPATEKLNQDIIKSSASPNPDIIATGEDLLTCHDIMILLPQGPL